MHEGIDAQLEAQLEQIAKMGGRIYVDFMIHYPHSEKACSLVAELAALELRCFLSVLACR